jgi:intracellular septation protein
MQLFLDLLPVIVFFVAYKLSNPFVATGALLVTVAAQVIYHWVRFRKVSQLTLVTAAIAFFFGSLTLIFHDQRFIQWKLSVIDWLFAAIFAATNLIGKEPLLQRMLGKEITLDRRTWLVLGWQWSALYLLLGTLNIFVMNRMTFDAWVYFRTFSAFIPPLLLLPAQGFWLYKQGKLTELLAEDTSVAKEEK